ncbi:MAG: S1C family serine protease [Acidimicrobiia bacterium]|nr:S1C family serine protease [Acidimicrobiia bacterium]
MSLEEWGSALRRVAAEVGPAVVAVVRHRAGGSGVVIGPNRVLTNAHNAGPEGVRVFFADGRVEESEVVGVDVDGDLIVLEVATGDAPVAEWGAGEALTLGTPVVAMSNPGGRGLRATVGFVSATGRPFRGPRGHRIEGSVEHTAPLPAGSSGGPLLDLDGRLVGLNTHRLGEGFYLALPATAAFQARARALAAGESPRGRRLGVGLAPVPVARRLRRAVGLPDAEGLLVRLVEEGSPAEAAGLGVGDLLVAAAGRPLVVVEDLHAVLDRLEGETIEVRVLRGIEERTVTIRFAG